MRGGNDQCGDYRMTIDRRPCRLAHPTPATNGQCRVCYLFLNSEKHKRLWTSPPPPPWQFPRPARRPRPATVVQRPIAGKIHLPLRPPCPHEGEVSSYGSSEL